MLHVVQFSLNYKSKIYQPKKNYKSKIIKINTAQFLLQFIRFFIFFIFFKTAII